MGNKRIPIAAKLLGGFAIVLALVAVLGWVSITRMASIDAGAQLIFEEDLESIVLTAAIEEEARRPGRDEQGRPRDAHGQ